MILPILARPLLAGAAAAAMLAPPALARDQAPAPQATELRIALAGKPPPAVRREVRSTARAACRNAIENRELPIEDLSWCSRRAGARALIAYRAAEASLRTSGD